MNKAISLLKRYMNETEKIVPGLGKQMLIELERVEAENERLRGIEYAANAAYNYWAGGDKDLPHRMRELRKALGGER